MTKQNLKHDIAIADSSGVEVGFNLIKKNNLPIYNELTSTAIGNQQTDGAPEYTDFRAEEEIRLVGDDFRDGFGSEYAGYQTAHRYHTSVNFDGRFGGKGRLAQTSTAATLPTTTTVAVTNGTMEADANWTGGARSNTRAHNGTYSWSVVENNVAYQDIAWDTEYQGRTFKVNCWVWRGAANVARIGIDDGIGITYSSYGITAAFEELTVTRRLENNATRFRILLVATNQATATTSYFDDCSITGQPTKGRINAQADFNGQHYITTGNILAKLNTAGTTYLYVWNSVEVDNLTDLCAGSVSGVDYLFMCQGWSNDYWYISPLLLDECDAAWSELIDPDVTVSIDSVDFKTGTGSLKMVVAAGAAANDILITQIISADLSTYTSIGFWVKSSVALDASDLQFLIDDTAKCASPTETLNLPAVAANTWTYVDLMMDNAPTAAAISMGIKMVVDKGAFTLRVDKIQAWKELQTNITGAEIKHMVMDGVTFRGDNTNSTIMSTAAPLVGGINWGTSYQVGEDAYDIVDIKMYGGLPYIKKANSKVFYLSATPAIVPLIEGQAGTNTARMYVHRKSDLIIPYGEQGLLHWDSTTLTHIEPALFMDNAGDFSGQVQAVTGDDMCLYIVMDDGADIQILSSKIGATVSDWGWHPLRTITTFDGCASASISSIYKKRMWIGSTLSTDSFYYIPVTTKYGDIESDTDMTYLTGGYLETSNYHLNLRGDKKAWVKITLTQAHAYSATIYWECHYKKLGDASWTKIGDFKGSATTDVTTKYLPVDASSNKPSSEMMQFKFVGITNDTSKTPILLSFDVEAIWYPTQRKLIYCQILCADDELTNIGTKDTIRAETKKALMDELYNPATAWPRAFYKINYEGAADLIYVKALPPKDCWIHDYQKGLDVNRIAWVYDCLFEEVDLS